MSLPDFSYDRDAVVVAGSTEIPVHAKLGKRYRQPLGEEWSGTLTPLDPNESFWAVVDAGMATLRTEDGTEATFLPGDFTSSPGRITRMPIRGNGRAPF
jgi:hypothetical protein